MIGMLGRVLAGVCIAAIAAPVLAASLADSAAQTRHPVGPAHSRILREGAEVANYRAGGSHLSVRKIAGGRKYTAVTLHRGATQDSGFAAWASQARKHRPKHGR
jgi:hypothetical protein